MSEKIENEQDVKVEQPAEERNEDIGHPTDSDYEEIIKTINKFKMIDVVVKWLFFAAIAIDIIMLVFSVIDRDNKLIVSFSLWIFVCWLYYRHVRMNIRGSNVIIALANEYVRLSKCNDKRAMIIALLEDRIKIYEKLVSNLEEMNSTRQSICEKQEKLLAKYKGK